MELKEVIQFLRWLVTFRSPKEIFVDHTSFLAVEVLFYIGFVLTLKHALRNGGRYFYLWLAALVHGLAVESLSYMIPDIDSFWHAQSSVMLFGQRLPLHIVCFYPVLIYTASVAVSRMKLPLWYEMCAVGIAMVVLDVPNDIIGIKLLWWTFHDTDPNLAERLYWVPWTSYFFFGAFMSSLTFCLHTFRKVVTGNKKYSAGGHLTEICCAIASGITAIPLGILQFALLYHIPHDIYKVPASVCTIIYLTTLCLLAWTGDRSVGTMTKLTKVTDNYQKKVDELFLFVVLYFSFFAILTFVAQPQSIFSAGFHQPIGSCDEKIPVHTPIGMVLSKNKYLCVSNYNEGYFDFHCAMQPTINWKHKDWYIICGTKFENQNEYIAVIISAAVFGIYFYYQLLINSGSDVLTGNPIPKFKTT